MTLITGWRLKLLKWVLRGLLGRKFHFAMVTELYLLIREEWQHQNYLNEVDETDRDLLVAFNRTLRMGEAHYRRF